MNHLDYDSIQANVYDLWRSRDHKRTINYLRDILDEDKVDDESVTELVFSLLNSTYISLGDRVLAESALRDGLQRLPSSFFLRRQLAYFLWAIAKRPEKALEVIDQVLDGLSSNSEDFASESKNENQIEALSLQGKILLTLGKSGEALDTLKKILLLQPPFTPIVGHLFDCELIVGLLNAKIRDASLRDFVNQITEPRFLTDGLSQYQFEEIKAIVNSNSYLKVPNTKSH